MRKLEELLKGIEDMRSELETLAYEDSRISEIIRQLDYFEIDTQPNSKGMIKIYCDFGPLPVIDKVRENDMDYAFVLLDFYCVLYYKSKKVSLSIRKRKYSEKINSLLHTLGMIIRKQALNDIELDKKFKTEQFCEDFDNFINVATKALGHKYDQIGHLTDTFNPIQAKELEHIRKIYEKISFKDDNTVTYFDYITKNYKTSYVGNNAEMQYMVMNLYAKAYMESVLWLRKEDPSEQWCPATPWQLLKKFEMLIRKYFLS